MNADKAQIEAKITEAMREALADPDNGADEALRYAVDVVKRDLDILCTYEYCGGFDSPGYDIDCYAPESSESVRMSTKLTKEAV